MGELERVIGALLDQENGQAIIGVERADRREDLLHDQRRQAERRLVEQKQRRASHQRAGDRQHLLLASRQRAAALMLTCLEQRKQRVDMLQILGEMRRIVGDDGAHLEILQHRHAREDAAALRRLHDAEPGHFMRGHGGNIAALEQDVAVSCARTTEDRHHQRCLAGAVAADQRDDLALFDVEIDAVQDRQHAVAGGHLAHLEQGFAHRPTSRSTTGSSSSGTPR